MYILPETSESERQGLCIDPDRIRVRKTYAALSFFGGDYSWGPS
jgi:hypothetical protein